MASEEQILGIAFFNGSVEEAVERHLSTGGAAVMPASPALVKLNYDQTYRSALQQADLVLPDSELLVLLWQMLTARRLGKISGIDYLTCLVSSSSFQEDRKVFWVLPSEAARDKASEWLQARGLRIENYTFHILPPPDVSSAHHPLLLEVEQKRPRHIVIALRGGGQEELGIYLRDYLLDRPAIHCVGAALGLLTGDESAIPDWAQRHHLGWLARLASQPRMLLPRMAIAVSVAAMVLRYRSDLPRLRTRWSDLLTMLILGLNAYHADSAACLIKDGKLVAAAEEERFRRIKHWAGLPTKAIDYCLKEGRVSLGEIAHIAVNRKPGVNNWRRLAFVLRHRPDPRLMLAKVRNIRSASSAKEALERAYGISLRAELHYVEHHLAHLASAFLVSGFEEAACLSVDGFGDFASTALGMGQGSDIEISRRVYFPHSLGIFYSALTQFIGFPHYGDEYKVMGLAPYGEPKYLDQMREIVHVQSDGTFKLNLKYFRHHTDNVSYSWNDCSPEVGTLFKPALADLLGPVRDPRAPLEQKHKDIARSTQAMYEEAFFALLQALHAQHPSDRLGLSGGCAMNSVANGKVYLNTPFKMMYLPAAAGDAGGAIGAAAVVNSQLEIRNAKLDSAYLGPEFSADEISGLLESRKQEVSNAECIVERIANNQELCARTATAIAEGKVVGWFQGRMEWGPRALGNRSILGDPRRADMKEILNAKIKRRESFRPFAPSILREAVAEWFEQDDDVPFMMEVFQIHPEKRNLIPAVCHLDGSGRLQTVHRETNPLYHQLITTFGELSGVPLVLNTSFNENEPVVCRPEEALDCFLRTKMDVLVMGSFFINRS